MPGHWAVLHGATLRPAIEAACNPLDECWRLRGAGAAGGGRVRCRRADPPPADAAPHAGPDGRPPAGCRAPHDRRHVRRHRGVVRRPASGVSSHYLVGLDGRVAQFVDEADTARHAGRVVDPTVDLAGRRTRTTARSGSSSRTAATRAGSTGRRRSMRAGADLLRDDRAPLGIPLDRAHVLAHREINADKTLPGQPRRRRAARAPPAARASSACCRCATARPTCRASSTRRPGSATPSSRSTTAAPTRPRSSSRRPARRRGAPASRRATSTRAGTTAPTAHRLLDAAARARPDWVLSLDADERIAADDARGAARVPGDRRAARRGVRPPAPARVGRRSRSRGHWVYRLFAPSRATRSPATGCTSPRSRRASPRARGSARRSACSTSAPPTQPRSQARAAQVRARPIRSGGGHRASAASTRPRRSAARAGPPRPRGPPASSTRSGVPRRRSDRRARLVVPARRCATARRTFPATSSRSRRFADAVVALDDGSTDATREILDAAPAVEGVLRNPRATSYAGWDDAANRNRLLDAAAELDARLAARPRRRRAPGPRRRRGAARFLDREADAGCAYGMRVFRMIGGLEHYDRAALWVLPPLRVPPGRPLPDDRLHFVPVPTSIPRERWVQTTIRIQHLASLTEERRRARFDKYREADPGPPFQRDYENLLARPDALGRGQRARRGSRSSPRRAARRRRARPPRARPRRPGALGHRHLARRRGPDRARGRRRSSSRSARSRSR